MAHPNPPITQPRKNASRAWGLLWARLRHYRPALFWLSLSLLTATLAVLCMGQAVAFLVNKAFGEDSLRYLDLSLLALFGLVFLLSLASFGRVYYSSILSERIGLDIKKHTMAHLLGQNSVFHDAHGPGKLVSQLSHDLTLVQALLNSSAPIAARNLLMAVGGIGMMVYTDGWLTCLVFACAPPLIAVLVLFAKHLRRQAADTQESQAQAHNQAAEMLGNLKLIQAYTHEAAELDLYASKLEQVFHLTKRYVRNRSFLVVLVMVSVFGAACFLLWMGATEVLENKLSVGTLTSFIFYALITAGSAGSLGELYTEFQRALAALDRIQELYVAPTRAADPEKFQGSTIAPPTNLVFHNVSFAYPTRPTTPVLKDFSLSLDLPKRLAIVGASGAGKSTLFQLLLGFYPLNAGAISINGTPTTKIPLPQLRALLAWVPQETHLPNETIESLLTYGAPNASTPALWRALEKAHLDGFVHKLPHNLQTLVGDRGFSLSAGQRQRLSLAQALLKDAPILLLDEATSALDAHNQRLIQKTLDNFKKKTMLIIAHRLSTVRYADEILVMHDGMVIDKGTHKELLGRCPIYKTLCAGELALD